MLTRELSWAEIHGMAAQVARELHENPKLIDKRRLSGIRIYGVPRGGVYAAMMVYREFAKDPSRMNYYHLIEDPNEADVFIDDIIDSGKTRDDFSQDFPGVPFHALVDRTNPMTDPSWMSFPWERMNKEQTGIEDNIVRLLQYIGEDPKRDGLLETPARVAKSLHELYSGYHVDVGSLFKVFDVPHDEMVVLKDVEFYSMCEHHMLPFHGKAHIAYIPQGKVIGVSKLARVLEAFSRRLQVQERLTEQVTDALMQHLQPRGAACVLEASHFCMKCRGVQKQNSTMVTSSLKGVFREPAARAEFLQFIKG